MESDKPTETGPRRDRFDFCVIASGAFGFLTVRQFLLAKEAAETGVAYTENRSTGSKRIDKATNPDAFANQVSSDYGMAFFFGIGCVVFSFIWLVKHRRKRANGAAK